MGDTIDIVITQLNHPQKIKIEGEITGFNKNEKSYDYTFRITTLEPNKGITIPASWEEIREHGTNTLIINKDDTRKLSFWTIKHINDNIYKITSYANVLEYLEGCKKE